MSTLEEASANKIQVRHKVTHLKMSLKRKGKDEKKKRGECKAESQPILARQPSCACSCTKLRKDILLLLNPANYRQSLCTNEGVKSFQTIAGVAINIPNTIHFSAEKTR